MTYPMAGTASMSYIRGLAGKYSAWIYEAQCRFVYDGNLVMEPQPRLIVSDRRSGLPVSEYGIPLR